MLRQPDEEALVASAASSGSAEPSAGRRWAVRCLALAGVAAIALGAAVHVAGAGKEVNGGSMEGEGAIEDELVSLQADGACATPDGFCVGTAAREDKLSYRDCDGDGVLDPYCEGGELLRFGFVSSKNGCESNWPNGLCRHAAEPSNSKGEFNEETAAGNEITIIHFNDVYQVSGVLESGVRRGGMSRAAKVIEHERRRNPKRTFVVFAGDLLSPSVLSDLFEGAQMVDILNYLNLDAASLGNHEFDFGVDVLERRVGESNFPWLNINLMDEAGNLLNGTKERLIRTVPFTPAWSKEEESAKVCLFGAAYDVRETMFKDKDRIRHRDALESSEAEARRLREEEGCNVVLALTHQFSRHDCEMSKQLGEKVDLILGGHDHSTELSTVCGHAPFVKADSDLKTQWIMTLWLDEKGKVESVDGRLLSLSDVDPFVPEVHDKILKWEERGEAEMGKRLGCFGSDVDAVASHVRQHETNAGNFFTDAVRAFHKTDVCLVNGGSICGNKVFGAGDVTKALITSMHPFGNSVAKIYATGKELRAYIEQQLECYDDVCGNFVAASGLKYTFDPSAEKGHRLESLTHSDGTELKDSEELTVAITDYMLSTSPLKNNKLYDMTTLNDAVPIVLALYDAVKKAGDSCLSPETDGRIKKLR